MAAKQIKVKLNIDSKTGQASIKKTSKSIKSLETQTKKSSKAMSNSMKLATTAMVAFGVAATLAFGKKSIDAASNLQEVIGKFSVVFRDQIDMAEKFSDTLVDSYGLSERAAKQYLSSVQDLLKPMGMASTSAAKMSNEIVKLSVDLGSFNNLGTEKVMMDMQSALVGNFETMKKYGVILNETVVKAEAYRLGLAKEGDLLDANIKAQAAYSLMVKGSKDAIGDWARTSENYANQLKQFKSNVEDISAAIGEPLMKALNGVLIETNKWIKANKGVIETKIKEYIKATADALKFLLDIIVKLGPIIEGLIVLKIGAYFLGIASSVNIAHKSVKAFKKLGFATTGLFTRMTKAASLLSPYLIALTFILGVRYVSGLYKASAAAQTFDGKLKKLNDELKRAEELAKQEYSFWNIFGPSVGEIQRAGVAVERLKKQIKDLNDLKKQTAAQSYLLDETDKARRMGRDLGGPKKKETGGVITPTTFTTGEGPILGPTAEDFEKHKSMMAEYYTSQVELQKQKEEQMWQTRLEYAQKNLATVEEFESKHLVLMAEAQNIATNSLVGTYALQITEIDKMADKYLEAGANRIAVEDWVAAEIKKIDEKSLKDAADNQKKKLQAMASLFDSMGSLFSQFSAMNAQMNQAGAKQDKSSFNRQKNLNMAQATMAGASAAVKALNVPGGWAGIAMAAIIGATTAVQVATISKQEFAYAKGGAFTNSIVSKPTEFNNSVMGEAGPEAIIPLGKTASGELGVKSSGAQGNTYNYYQVTAMDAQSVSDVLRRNPNAVTTVINEEIQKGNSALNNNLKKAVR